MVVSRQLEKYELLEEVGQGGMAVVYRGKDTTLNREVAIKILHPHLAKEIESKQRFQREAHAVAKLRHDNILEIYDYSGLDSDQSYIVTEFIHGHTLKEFLARHPISHPEIAAMIIVEVCQALAHAHSLGVIHRDIKPENIMVRGDGRVKLMDFGIAQIVDVQKLTVTGQLLGSPAYMAPELVSGRPLDFRSDVFSVGTLLYQLATGELPFKGKNPHEVLKRIADGRFVAPEVCNPIVGSQLGKIIRRALASDPDARYASIEALCEDLRIYLEEASISETREELASYFEDPANYSRGLQDRTVTALVARGKATLQAGNKARALQYFDRVLCAEPQHREVLGILERLARRRRLGRVLAVLAAVGLLGGGAYALVEHWPLLGSGAKGSHAGSSAALVHVAETPAIDGGPPASDHAVSNGSTTAVVDGRSGARGEPDASRDSRAAKTTTAHRIHRPTHVHHAPPKRKVEIIPFPKAVSIWLDGKKLGVYGPDLRYVRLPRGAATLTIRNEACCFERQIKIKAGQTVRQLRVRLPWKPGRLRVNVKPSVEAHFAVGSAQPRGSVGAVAAKAGQTIAVKIPSDSSDGRTTVSVRVQAAGYATQARRVTVRANRTRVITVPLTRNR